MKSSDASRHEILTAFARECPALTNADLAEWQRRYPKCSRALSETIRKAREEEIHRIITDAGIVESVVKTRMRQLYPNGVPLPLHEALANAGVDVKAVADDVGFGHDLIAMLARGDVGPPIGHNVLDAFAKTLEISALDVSHAVTAAIVSSRSVQAPARRQPGPPMLTWAAAVAASSLTEEQKAFLME